MANLEKAALSEPYESIDSGFHVIIPKGLDLSTTISSNSWNNTSAIITSKLVPQIIVTQKWKLSTIHFLFRESLIGSGEIIFIVQDNIGRPVNNVTLAIGWKDQSVVLLPNYRGRFCFQMEMEYNPLLEKGPYWGGFMNINEGPRIHGLGIPIKYKCEIKVVFSLKRR